MVPVASPRSQIELSRAWEAQDSIFIIIPLGGWLPERKLSNHFLKSFFKWKILVTPLAQCACYRGESTVARHRGVRLLKCWEGHYWVKPRSLTLRYDVHGGVWLCGMMYMVESDSAVRWTRWCPTAVWWTRLSPTLLYEDMVVWNLRFGGHGRDVLWSGQRWLFCASERDLTGLRCDLSVQ